MSKTTTYGNLLTILDYELEQMKEYPDTADADSFRNLPRTEAPRTINDVIKSLVRQKDDAYTEEVIFHFYDSTLEHYPLRSGEYFYIDINESVNGYIFTVPKNIKEIKNYVQPNTSSDTAQRTGYWEVLNDSSVSAGSIYSPSKDTIYNDGGWTAGDELRVRAVIYPTDLKATIAAVSMVALSTTLNINGTVTTATASSMNVERGDIVTVSSANPSAYNGTYTVVHKNGVTIIMDPVTAIPSGAFVSGSIGFVSDNQIVGIDDGFIRLLTLEIKKVAYSRKQKSMSTEEYYELTREKRVEWLADKGRVNSIATLNYGGANFGRKR